MLRGLHSPKDSYLWSMDLVTGATGIVGREIVAALLLAGGEVRALRRERSDVEGVEKMLGRRGVSREVKLGGR